MWLDLTSSRASFLWQIAHRGLPTASFFQAYRNPTCVWCSHPVESREHYWRELYRSWNRLSVSTQLCAPGTLPSLQQCSTVTKRSNHCTASAKFWEALRSFGRWHIWHWRSPLRLQFLSNHMSHFACSHFLQTEVVKVQHFTGLGVGSLTVERTFIAITQTIGM